MSSNATIHDAAPRRDASSPPTPAPLEEVWEGPLEKIEAVIREDRLYPVLTAIGKLGHDGVTVSHVQGHGRERPARLQWRGMPCRSDFLPRVRLELIAHQPDTDGIIDAICTNARTGAVGDGKIWVTPVSRLIRVRNGEVGAIAV